MNPCTCGHDHTDHPSNSRTPMVVCPLYPTACGCVRFVAAKPPVAIPPQRTMCRRCGTETTYIEGNSRTYGFHQAECLSEDVPMPAHEIERRSKLGNLL